MFRVFLSILGLLICTASGLEHGANKNNLDMDTSLMDAFILVLAHSYRYSINQLRFMRNSGKPNS